MFKIKAEQSQQKPPQNPVSLEQALETRTFVFEKEQTHQSTILNFSLNLLQQYTDLSLLFRQYCPEIDTKVSIYNPETNSFLTLPPNATTQIPTYLLQTPIIMVRFRSINNDCITSESDSGVESGADEGREKKDRSKQRTIGEAIQLVRRWRALHLSSGEGGRRRVSLKEAARSVGVSKKSLDDYYYQLRLGEFYNFDFANNLHEKVGILRAYVKQFKPERDEKNKNLRHPKNLKIIEEDFNNGLPQFLTDTPQIPPIFPEIKPPPSDLSFDEQSLQSFGSRGNPFLSDVIETYKDKFFKNFEFLLDDPGDPFVEINGNFKKKEVEEENSDFFFF